MTLTIPQAGVIGGRAAEVRVQPADTGAILSDFGQAIADQALKYKAEKLDMQGKKAQIDIARDLGLARQEVEQLGDPEAIGAAWDARVADIRTKHLDGTDEAGNPLVPSELRPGLELTIGELGNRHSLALGGRAIGLRQSQREADWIGMRDQITLQAAKADPQTLEAVLEVGEAAIDSRAASGLISPSDAAKEKLDLRRDALTARSTDQISTDPAGFLAAAEAGNFNGLGAEVLASRKVTAQNELARREAAAAKAIEMADKARSDAIGKRLTVITDLLADGNSVTDEALLDDPEVQAHPNFPAAAAAKSLRDELPRIRVMTPAEIEAQIAAEEAAPKTHKFQTERLKVLRQWHDSAVTKWNSAAVDQARSAKMPVPDLPDLDPTDPSDFTAGLAGRLSMDAKLRADGFTKTQAVLDDAEAVKLRAVLDPKADAAPKLALAASLLEASGGNPERVLDVLGADPEFRRATTLLANTGQASLASEILTGQQKLKLGTVSLPPIVQRQLVLDNITAGAFDDQPRLKAEILSAASALYANGAAGINSDGEKSIIPFMSDRDAVDLFQTAVQRVMGGNSSNGLDFGGVREVNGHQVVLPSFVSSQAAETAMEAVRWRLGGYVKVPKGNAIRFRGINDGWYLPGELRGVSPAELPPQPSGIDLLRAASIDGQAPALGDEAKAWQRWPNTRLRPALGEPEGTDIYELVLTENGREYVLPRADGVAFRFSLSKLASEAAK